MGVTARTSMRILTLAVILSIVAAQEEEEVCCLTKQVRGVTYNLVGEQDTSNYNCKSNCIFEKEGAPGSRYCFASGTLPVFCGDSGSERQIICNYRPKTDVMEHWEIDLDQRDFVHFLGQNNFTAAKNVYDKGANSMKTSDVDLAAALTQAFDYETPVTQGSNKGQLNKEAEMGATTIKVGIFTPCTSIYGQIPNTSGCFTSGGGPFFVDGTDVGSGTVTLKYRTLEKFSTEAEAKMSGKEMFEKYKAYYGVGDYSHKYITAAVDGTDATGTLVSMDFSGKDDDYRTASAIGGSKLWNIWMYAIWEMEDAIDDCNANCSPSDEVCNDAPVHAWDEAWAFYTGSLEGKFGNAAGIFPYRLAENMCMIMDTCLAGKSKVNRELEDAFIDGKNMIDQGNCDGAKAFKSTIMTKMSIPLVQATFNSAYSILDGDTSSQAKAK